ncbi:hypothetical protein, variant 1 [Aphanomyces invadans]|uniref:Uncharacterized protein n=2 Tax=Aphanomyces invadans TaxID=157072 RepID=A0A024U2L4_9STRA|nr:hypothetical protein, variant 1 [Aphanomyces invadans]ETW00435.1 hypothetical protein, variant 1 [Aphanomyces invadans]|eukprot:XP_008870570.1 hypothetical protein, variant 1 [Aphanomyces invadans]
MSKSSIELEWRNLFHHPVEDDKPAPKAAHALSTNAMSVATTATSKPPPKSKPNLVPGKPAAKEAACFMTEEQLLRLIDAISHVKAGGQGVQAKVDKRAAMPGDARKSPSCNTKPAVAPPPLKPKATFIRDAIPLALQAMTETMQMALQRGGDGDHSGIWMTSRELETVVDAFLTTSSDFHGAAEPSLVGVPSPDLSEQLTTSTATCHLCLSSTSEHWCCECSTALCPQCLQDVCCNQLRHHVEVYVPTLSASTNLGVQRRGEKQLKLAEKQADLKFVPLVVGSALLDQLRTTRLAGCDGKALKQFCMLLKKQIEMQPMSKFEFLDRSCITAWSPEEVRGFLDVLRIPSDAFADRNVAGDQFLRLSVPALHDTYGITGSFPLHRCLFYRSLLSFMDQWVRSQPPAKAKPPARAQAAPTVPAKPWVKRKKKANRFVWGDPVEPRSANHGRQAPSQTTNAVATKNALPRAFNASTDQLNEPASTIPRGKQRTRPPTVPAALSPVTKVHSSTDEDFVQQLQNEMNDVHIPTTASPRPSTSMPRQEAVSRTTIPRSSLGQLQQTMSDLVQRLEVAQSLPTSDDAILTRIAAANALVHKVLHMTPHELSAECPVDVLRPIVLEIEDRMNRPQKASVPHKRERHTNAPVQLREAKHLNKWTFDMPEPVVPATTVAAPGPSDYNTDNVRAFPMQKPSKQKQPTKPMTSARRVQSMLSNLGFHPATTSTTAASTRVSTRMTRPTRVEGDDDDVLDSPPPFDVAEFVAEEVQSRPSAFHTNTPASRLYSTSFLDDPALKPLHTSTTSAWQTMRKKYTPVEVQTASDFCNPARENATGMRIETPLKKTKPASSDKPKKPKDSHDHSVQERPDHVVADVENATKAQADTTPHPSATVAAGNAVQWAKRIHASYTPLVRTESR